MAPSATENASPREYFKTDLNFPVTMSHPYSWTQQLLVGLSLSPTPVERSPIFPRGDLAHVTSE
jgi:hypothetical protein